MVLVFVFARSLGLEAATIALFGAAALLLLQCWPHDADEQSRRVTHAFVIGASANLVVAGFAERAGQPIRFVRFLMVAFPLMLLSVAISTVICTGGIYDRHASPRSTVVAQRRRFAAIIRRLNLAAAPRDGFHRPSRLEAAATVNQLTSAISRLGFTGNYDQMTRNPIPSMKIGIQPYL